jgi:hypothetical protein
LRARPSQARASSNSISACPASCTAASSVDWSRALLITGPGYRQPASRPGRRSGCHDIWPVRPGTPPLRPTRHIPGDHSGRDAAALPGAALTRGPPQPGDSGYYDAHLFATTSQHR